MKDRDSSKEMAPSKRKLRMSANLARFDEVGKSSDSPVAQSDRPSGEKAKSPQVVGPESHRPILSTRRANLGGPVELPSRKTLPRGPFKTKSMILGEVKDDEQQQLAAAMIQARMRGRSSRRLLGPAAPLAAAPEDASTEFEPVGYAVALYDWAGDTADMVYLKFQAGDRLAILERGDEGGWWLGRLSGGSGWFPSGFVEEEQAVELEGAIAQPIPEAESSGPDAALLVEEEQAVELEDAIAQPIPEAESSGPDAAHLVPPLLKEGEPVLQSARTPSLLTSMLTNRGRAAESSRPAERGKQAEVAKRAESARRVAGDKGKMPPERVHPVPEAAEAGRQKVSAGLLLTQQCWSSEIEKVKQSGQGGTSAVSAVPAPLLSPSAGGAKSPKKLMSPMVLTVLEADSADSPTGRKHRKKDAMNDVVHI